MNGKAEKKYSNNDQDARLRILMLEDSPTDAELIEYELKRGGLSFVSRRVETEESFAKALEEFKPDLILSDYDLPRYDGVQALFCAKRRRPDVPFILVTGAVTEDRAIEVLTSGARDYVLKKKLNRLVPAVERALSEAEEHRARRRAESELQEAYVLLEERIAERTADLERARLDAERDKSRLEAVLEALPVGTAITDVKGKTVHSNKAFEQIWGVYCSAESSEKHCSKAFWADSGEPVRLEEWASAIAVREGESISGQLLEIERFDGTRAIVMNSASPIRDSKGKITGSATVIQDVTWLYRAKEALEEKEESFRELADNLPQLVWTATPDGRINFLNGRRVELSCPKEDRSGYWDWRSAVHPEDLPELRKKWKRAVETGSEIEAEHRLKTRDGTYRYYLSRGVPVRDGQGQVKKWIGTTTDVHNLKLAACHEGPARGGS